MFKFFNVKESNISLIKSGLNSSILFFIKILSSSFVILKDEEISSHKSIFGRNFN